MNIKTKHSRPIRPRRGVAVIQSVLMIAMSAILLIGLKNFFDSDSGIKGAAERTLARFTNAQSSAGGSVGGGGPGGGIDVSPAEPPAQTPARDPLFPGDLDVRDIFKPRDPGGAKQPRPKPGNKKRPIREEAQTAEDRIRSEFGRFITNPKSPSAAKRTKIHASFEEMQQACHSNDAGACYSREKDIIHTHPGNTPHQIWHEVMHREGSAEFHRKFRKVGDNDTKLAEGVTELYTRRVSPGRSPNYNPYSDEAKYARKIENEVGADTLKRAYFGGDKAAMKKVEQAIRKIEKGPDASGSDGISTF